MGQQIPFSKSAIFFSGNVDCSTKNHMLELLGIHTEQATKYLGLPSNVERSKKEVFQFVKERVQKRILGWKESLLSRAGKDSLQFHPLLSFTSFATPYTVEQSNWVWNDFLDPFCGSISSFLFTSLLTLISDRMGSTWDHRWEDSEQKWGTQPPSLVDNQERSPGVIVNPLSRKEKQAR